MKRIAFLSFTIFIALTLVGCSWFTRRVNLGEPFTMRPKDKVTVVGTDLTIQLEEVGHQTFSVPAPGPAAYVVLQIRSGNHARVVRVGVGESAEEGVFIVKVNAANPFHSEDGPRCELTVTRK